MQLYTLHPDTFLIADAVDDFDSLIWTERYNEFGDVTLVVPSSAANRQKLQEGVMLYTPDSREVALIETYSDENGQITLTGPFLVGYLQQKILRDTWKTNKSEWKLTGRVGDIAGTIVREMCIQGYTMSTPDTVLPGNMGTIETIANLSIGAAPTGSSTTVSVPYGNVYDGVKMVCDLENLGFTMYPINVADGTGRLTFLVYRGADRTSAQSVNPVVAFSDAMDSLSEIKEVRSLAGYKTAAYAWASNMTDKYSIGQAWVSGTTALRGWTRRALMVDASDVNSNDYADTNELFEVLNKRAQDALVNNNYVRMTDGQLVPQTAFVYGRDYQLGDIIELRGNTTASNARITEYIRVQDDAGERAYPTLSVV